MPTFRLTLFGLLVGTCCVAQPPPPEMLEVENQELKTVVQTLRAENRKLEQRNQQLMNDVLNLGHQIRALQARLEAQPAQPAQPDAEPGVTEDPDPSTLPKSALHPILSVNVTYHYLIVQTGSESGIQIGEGGSVIRDGEIIAAVKVTDTKPHQSIVQIDLDSLVREGIYPRKDDKVRFP